MPVHSVVAADSPSPCEVVLKKLSRLLPFQQKNWIHLDNSSEVELQGKLLVLRRAGSGARPCRSLLEDPMKPFSLC